MAGYIDTLYSANEYDPGQYPQRLCDYLAERFFAKVGDCRGKLLLDVGSGKGNHLVGFARKGMITKGLDKRRESVETLRDFDIRECDIEVDAFPFGDSHFDFVFSKSVLEHVYNTHNVVKETFRVLKPGGITVQITPDWLTDFRSFWDDPTHVKPFTKKGLQHAFLFEHFTEVQCFDFYQLPFLWKHPRLTFLAKLSCLLPDALKWKDKERSVQRVLIRHAKERMLLLFARKPDIDG